MQEIFEFGTLFHSTILEPHLADKKHEDYELALAMRDTPADGLAAIDALFARGMLRDYHLAHAARADLCRRLGRVDDARGAYTEALALTRQEPERRFIQRRLQELPNAQ